MLCLCKVEEIFPAPNFSSKKYRMYVQVSYIYGSRFYVALIRISHISHKKGASEPATCSSILVGWMSQTSDPISQPCHGPTESSEARSSGDDVDVVHLAFLRRAARLLLAALPPSLHRPQRTRRAREGAGGLSSSSRPNRTAASRGKKMSPAPPGLGGVGGSPIEHHGSRRERRGRGRRGELRSVDPQRPRQPARRRTGRRRGWRRRGGV